MARKLGFFVARLEAVQRFYRTLFSIVDPFLAWIRIAFFGGDRAAPHRSTYRATLIFWFSPMLCHRCCILSRKLEGLLHIYPCCVSALLSISSQNGDFVARRCSVYPSRSYTHVSGAGFLLHVFSHCTFPHFHVAVRGVCGFQVSGINYLCLRRRARTRRGLEHLTCTSPTGPPSWISRLAVRLVLKTNEKNINKAHVRCPAHIYHCSKPFHELPRGICKGLTSCVIHI